MPETADSIQAEMSVWVDAQLRQRNVESVIHPERIERKNWLLKIPVYVRGWLNGANDAPPMDAFEKAHVLQEVEDAWNNQEPEPSTVIILLPTARV